MLFRNGELPKTMVPNSNIMKELNEKKTETHKNDRTEKPPLINVNFSKSPAQYENSSPCLSRIV